ncbi:ABC transporter substrate-binding protein [Amycolatopsis jiangsuensis]|uniref:Iron(III) transport system substrate-binding protein n=1 Tax=Amycolatopsis jiangsuensis TaxID=1181879 RepID=A0A840ISM1_9PSEU|nr:extracellular solute-binding protein [Amycolatopsis jiangsuensis]MBB4683994.1 iron(III) transport system substrate-binding protein [Amycolatopsis jiangsuensis]
MLRLGVLAVLIALLGTACSEPPPVPDARNLGELYRAAKAEGQVIWFAPKPEAQMRPAIRAFEKKYPGITVKYTNKKAPDLVTQLNVEQAAGRVSFDVSNAGGLTVLPSLDMAAPVDWSAYQVPGDQIFDGNFVYVWAVPKVWAYNTDALPAGAAPRDWDGLLSPRWNGGKLTVESRGSFMTVWAQDRALGTDAGLRFASRLGQLHPHYTDNTTQAHTNVISGQTPVGTDLINLVLADRAKGAPIAVAPVGPTNANKAYLFVPDGSPHPAAGRLLTAFLASPEGQSALVGSYNSIIPDDTDCSQAGRNPVVAALCQAGVGWFSETDIRQYQQFADFFPQVEHALGTDVN